MAKNGDLKQFMKAVGVLATALGIGAMILKALSPGQRCLRCDRVLQVVSAVQAICPGCGVARLRV